MGDKYMNLGPPALLKLGLCCRPFPRTLKLRSLSLSTERTKVTFRFAGTCGYC